VSQNETTINGREVFELYDTYGFPVDLTALIARENGFQIDEPGFQQAMAEQKNRSKADATSEKGDWTELLPDVKVEFVGYDHEEAESRIIKYREIKEKKRTVFQIVLDKTPFYGESGGQVGDTGVIESQEETIKILDTQKENDLIVHFTDKLPANPAAVFHARIDKKRRALIKFNHSATHLLHAALREVLGHHVQQKGSLVSDSVLRFDFSHFSKVEPEQIEQIEQIVNEKIRENITLNEKRSVPIEEAKSMGAMALFGEKYGDFVRVITFNPDYSVELCGGTHVEATGQIGLFKIVSESAVAAGVRRIEAYTGPKAFEYVQDQEKELKLVKELLKNPKDLTKAIASLLDEQKKLTKEIESLHARQGAEVKRNLLQKVEAKKGINVLIEQIDIPSADALKKLSFELKNEVDNLLAILAANVSGSPQISVVISENLVKEKSLNAGQLVRELAREIKGGGGGQPFFATAGGKDITGLERVVTRATEILESFA